MNSQLIITFFLVLHLRKSLQTASLLPRWNKILLGIMYAAIGLQVLQMSVHDANTVIEWLAHLLVLFLIWIIYSQKEFRSARSIMFAVLPFIAFTFLNDIVHLFKIKEDNPWNEYYDPARFFSVIWMVTLIIITRRQKKALDKERVKTIEEERRSKIMAELKGQLEIQVAERTAELTNQKEELEQTLIELRSAQAQLIQSEKMASLGELTAGIAHEIQNPLNFVNNFSEVSNELIDEMNDELNKGAIEEAKSIASDIQQNLGKIHHHGKRAEAIVKGMLQHSQTSIGRKEPTNINDLADEYLRLAYHGLKAKDNTFNTTMRTGFDESIGNINIIPQDIGRVLLNLCNNAFYAVNEKKKQQGESYEPTVSVFTKKSNGKVEISVKDNGDGIPQKIVDKIFQPFFTTKPTGQGTGLGLSLSYDIIKAHGGEIKAETKEGEGTTFIIQLPVS